MRRLTSLALALSVSLGAAACAAGGPSDPAAADLLAGECDGSADAMLMQALNAMHALTIDDAVGDGVAGLFDDGRKSATLGDALNKLYFKPADGITRTIKASRTDFEENVIELDILIESASKDGTSSSTITVTFAGDVAGGAPILASDQVAVFLGT